MEDLSGTLSRKSQFSGKLLSSTRNDVFLVSSAIYMLCYMLKYMMALLKNIKIKNVHDVVRVWHSINIPCEHLSSYDDLA